MSGAHIAIAAARHRKQIQEEEETMTLYTQDDLAGHWEFKIIRSSTGAFKNRAKLAALLEEEALAGWEMVELFDHNRVRLKRLSSDRRKDGQLPPGLDPYRTQVGLAEGPLVAAIIGAILAVGLGVALLFSV